MYKSNWKSLPFLLQPALSFRITRNGSFWITSLCGSKRQRHSSQCNAPRSFLTEGQRPNLGPCPYGAISSPPLHHTPSKALGAPYRRQKGKLMLAMRRPQDTGGRVRGKARRGRGTGGRRTPHGQGCCRQWRYPGAQPSSPWASHSGAGVQGPGLASSEDPTVHPRTTQL